MNKNTVLLILMLSVGFVYLCLSNLYTDRNSPASSQVPTFFIPPNEDRRLEKTITPDASLNLTATTTPADNAPKAFSNRIKTIPNYRQNDPAYGGLPGSQDGDPGSMYCAPAAVSNSLMWLEDQGFENIVENETGDRKFDQFQLILELSSPEYLNTDVEIGTSHANILEGLELFLGDRGYKYQSLGHQGWMPVPDAYNRGDLVSLEWMQEGLQDCGSVWFSIGFFDYQPEYDIYTLKRSHMVTLVGFGHDGTGPNPNALAIHDPLQVNGTAVSEGYLIAEEIDRGVLEGSALGLPRPADGYFRLEGVERGEGEIAVLNSAIVLKMPGECPD